jgi:hypothetical protein
MDVAILCSESSVCGWQANNAMVKRAKFFIMIPPVSHQSPMP